MVPHIKPSLFHFKHNRFLFVSLTKQHEFRVIASEHRLREKLRVLHSTVTDSGLEAMDESTDSTELSASVAPADILPEDAFAIMANRAKKTELAQLQETLIALQSEGSMLRHELDEARTHAQAALGDLHATSNELGAAGDQLGSYDPSVAVPPGSLPALSA